MQRLDVATLNLRNLSDRWEERLPLLLADMRTLQPDLIGFQECVFPLHQDRVIAAAGEGRYGGVRGWAGRPEYGNTLLAREPLVAAGEERLDLGDNRSAVKARIALDGGLGLTFAVTHLHHVPADEGVREAQVRALVTWLDGDDSPDAQIVVGDFNAEPVEPAYARMVEAGFRSGYAEVHGHEPSVTWPSGIQAPGMDTDGEPGCLDYVWLRGAVRAEAASLAFDHPAIDDPTLYPSDHFGLVVRVVLGDR